MIYVLEKLTRAREERLGAGVGGLLPFQMRGGVSESLRESVTHEQWSEGNEWIPILDRGKSKCQVPKAGEECM